MDSSPASYQFQQVKSEPMDTSSSSAFNTTSSPGISHLDQSPTMGYTGPTTTNQVPFFPIPTVPSPSPSQFTTSAQNTNITVSASGVAVPSFTVKLGDNIIATAPVINPETKPEQTMGNQVGGTFPQASGQTFGTTTTNSSTKQPIAAVFEYNSSGPVPVVKSTPPPTPTPIIPGPASYSFLAPGGHTDSAGFSMSDLLVQLEDYTPTIPDSVSNHFLHMAGFESTDPRISRLISIAAQKFISDILNDAFTHCKLRSVAPVGGKQKIKDKKYVLTMEDLVPVLNDYGITVKKPPYFV